MAHPVPFGVVALAGALLVAACAGAPASPAAAPVPSRPVPAAPDSTPVAPVTPVRPVLPAFPRVIGALAIDVVAPPEGHLLGARDSTFIFGSVGTGDAALTINGAAVQVNPNGSFMAYLPVPGDSAYRLLATRPGGDTATAVRAVRFPSRTVSARPAAVLDTAGFPRVVTLRNTNADAASDTDMVTVVRPAPGGTYKWFLLPGTAVQATGRLGGSVRIRLDSRLEAWIDSSAAAPGAGADTAVRVRRLSAARVVTGAGFTDVVLPMDARAPFAVDVAPGQLALTVYGARGNIDLIRYDTQDPTVRLVRWEQESSDRVRLLVDLRHDAVGYLVFWRAGAMVLRVRHLPVVHADAPLKGRVIAVDPGHPPAGTVGPTRFREPEATLAIGEQLQRLLEARGARVVMLRSTMDAVALGARPIAARRADADAFVSIHLNAFADGANPFAAARGSGTFFFHPQSEPLARAVQQGLVRHLGLRDEGVFFNNLAVVRATWFPAVLAEGAWLVMPEQEAALRTREFQAAYAMGIVDGLEAYFRGLVPR